MGDYTDDYRERGYCVVATLGEAGTTVFLSNCPLCRLVIVSALQWTPNTSNCLELTLSETPYVSYIDTSKLGSMFDRSAGPNNVPRSLFLTHSWYRQPSLSARIGISLAQSGLDGLDLTSAFRRVDSKPNFSLVKLWIDKCVEFHLPCRPLLNQDVLRNIRVVDVLERKVVSYDMSPKPDFITLSYVWGGVSQKAYALNAYLPPFPQIIEDAMEVVRKLDKRYSGWTQFT